MNDRYFSRAATWYRMDGRLVVHDSLSLKAPRVITMEPCTRSHFWRPTACTRSRSSSVTWGSQYEGGPPAGLREQIHGIINELVAEGVVRVHDQPKALPAYFAEEHFQQPPAVRKAQMEGDGRIGRTHGPA